MDSKSTDLNIMDSNKTQNGIIFQIKDINPLIEQSFALFMEKNKQPYRFSFFTSVEGFYSGDYLYLKDVQLFPRWWGPIYIENSEAVHLRIKKYLLNHYGKMDKLAMIVDESSAEMGGKIKLELEALGYEVALFHSQPQLESLLVAWGPQLVLNFDRNLKSLSLDQSVFPINPPLLEISQEEHQTKFLTYLSIIYSQMGHFFPFSLVNEKDLMPGVLRERIYFSLTAIGCHPMCYGIHPDPGPGQEFGWHVSESKELTSRQKESLFLFSKVCSLALSMESKALGISYSCLC